MFIIVYTTNGNTMNKNDIDSWEMVLISAPDVVIFMSIIDQSRHLGFSNILYNKQTEHALPCTSKSIRTSSSVDEIVTTKTYLSKLPWRLSRLLIYHMNVLNNTQNSHCPQKPLWRPGEVHKDTLDAFVYQHPTHNPWNSSWWSPTTQ